VEVVGGEVFSTFRRKGADKQRAIDSVLAITQPSAPPDNALPVEGAAKTSFATNVVASLPLGAVPFRFDTLTGLLHMVVPQGSTFCERVWNSRTAQLSANCVAQYPGCPGGGFGAESDTSADALPAFVMRYRRWGDTLTALACQLDQPWAAITHRDQTQHYTGFELLDARPDQHLLAYGVDLILADYRPGQHHLAHLLFSGSGLFQPGQDSLLVADYSYQPTNKSYETTLYQLHVHTRQFVRLAKLRHPQFTLRPIGWDVQRQLLYLQQDFRETERAGVFSFHIPTQKLELVYADFLQHPIFTPDFRALYGVRYGQAESQIVQITLRRPAP
jgi:hypothetical protein